MKTLSKAGDDLLVIEIYASGYSMYAGRYQREACEQQMIGFLLRHLSFGSAEARGGVAFGQDSHKNH